jgi:hypothetical protein
MSFGFPESSQSVRDAIHDVKRFRKGAIVFLASAGNDVDRSEAYPACDPSVISMYATDSAGTFLNTNTSPSNGSRRSLGCLGTYGEAPDDILAELRAQYTNGDFSAGTSVATAAAAGIVGLMLTYARLMPHAMPGCDVEGVCSDLKTTHGMRCMLFAMAQTWHERQHFINPVRFWSYRPSDSSMYRAMCEAVPLGEVMGYDTA